MSLGYCIKTNARKREDGVEIFDSLCGRYDEYTEAWFVNDPNNRQVCSKCAAKHFAPLLAERGTLTKCDNPRDAAHPYYKEFRSQYELRRNGDARVIGYVACLQGWGKGWVALHASNAEADGAKQMGHSSEHRAFASKEHAALFMLDATGFNTFKPALEPEEFLALRRAEATQRRREEIDRMRDNIKTHGERIIANQAERDLIQAKRDVLASINVESNAAQAAIAYALTLVDKEIERCERGVTFSIEKRAEIEAKLNGGQQ